MALEFLSGAVLTVDTHAQAHSVPADTAFEPMPGADGRQATDPHGRLRYREVNPAVAAMSIIRMLSVELAQAASALFQAATAVKDSGKSPLLASQIHLAAQRAQKSSQEVTSAGRTASC